MQISYEMVSNAHVLQLTVSLKAVAHHHECATTPIIPAPAFPQTHLFLAGITTNSDPHRNLSDQSQAQTL